MPTDWLTIGDETGRARAVLHTVIHRRPRDLAVSLTTAARLAARGVPVIVRGFDGAPSGNAV